MMLLEKNQPTFLFYDYETFGLHTALDKPAQFACIRTDLHLNIIDTPQCLYCFPSDDYLPDPDSLIITRITPQYTHKFGTNEYNFSKKIYDLLTISNTCIVGYNNINFDDEITRNIFYRNFFDPYEWSWKNGNSRWDLLSLTRACYALRPSGIKWPKNELGLPSFKLSELTNINNITHLNVHDAMSDVYATIAIAKLIKKKQPKLFDFFYKNRNKNNLRQLIDLNKFQKIVYVSSYFGASRKNISCVSPIIWHPCNKNVLIAVDLFQDVEKLVLFAKKICYQNDYIKILFNLGIMFLYFNRCPILAPIQVLRPKDYNRLQLNSHLYDVKIEYLKKNKNFIKNIQIIFSQEKHDKESSNVDLQIYHDFFNAHDKKIIKFIRNTQPIYLKKMNYNFQDLRLKTLLFRYRARNFFDTLNNNEKKIWLKYCLKIFEPSSLEKYKNKIIDLLKKHSTHAETVIILNDLLNYVFQKYKFLLDAKANLN